MLFRQDADCYRILGIEPTASRATARNHMRWLLEWLHPDRNNNQWDAVYAERVLRAWREVSASQSTIVQLSDSGLAASLNKKKSGDIEAIWLPWIAHSRRPSSTLRNSYTAFVIWAIPTSLVIIFLILWSADQLFRP
jgi:hypothetical protein